jgi:hypothetical protein
LMAFLALSYVFWPYTPKKIRLNKKIQVNYEMDLLTQI